MAVSKKYNRTECARIDDHEVAKGFNTPEKWLREGTPTDS